MASKGRTYGTWRALLNLVESVNRDLGPNTCAYFEDEILNALEDGSPCGMLCQDQKGPRRTH